jgi:hypothetical protein
MSIAGFIRDLEIIGCRGILEIIFPGLEYPENYKYVPHLQLVSTSGMWRTDYSSENVGEMLNRMLL